MKRWLALMALTVPLAAQSDNNFNAWFMYFGDHPISKSSKWGVHLEGQWRRADVGLTWQQLLLRPGVNYQLTKNVSLTGGYGFVDTHRYGDFPAVANFPEHRFFEQVTINKRAKLDFANRFRLEQRNIGVMVRQPDGSYAVGSYRYENRIRYQLRTTIPLAFGDKKNYLALSNEIKFNFGKNVDKNVFDQNRAYIALGRDLGHQTRFEAGFMEQTLQRRGGLIFEHNHTLQFAIYSRLPFGE